MSTDYQGLNVDEYPDLQPGNTVVVEQDGHTFHVTATKHPAFLSGRRRYMVECVSSSCGYIVHPASTSSHRTIENHVADASHGIAHAWPFRDWRQ